jgi:hypothetical protein
MYGLKPVPFKRRPGPFEVTRCWIPEKLAGKPDFGDT